MNRITVFASFEAAHYLPFVAEGHKCGRLHGHTYHVQATVSGPLDEKLGWVIDYADIKYAMDNVIQEVDHQLLNAITGLGNPTTEHLSRWLFERIKKSVPSLVKIRVAENPYSFCEYIED